MMTLAVTSGSSLGCFAARSVVIAATAAAGVAVTRAAVCWWCSEGYTTCRKLYCMKEGAKQHLINGISNQRYRQGGRFRSIRRKQTLYHHNSHLDPYKPRPAAHHPTAPHRSPHRKWLCPSPHAVWPCSQPPSQQLLVGCRWPSGQRVGPSTLPLKRVRNSTAAVRYPLARGIAANPLAAWVSVCADVEKVVDMLKADELPKKAVFCRCWRSEKVRR